MATETFLSNIKQLSRELVIAQSHKNGIEQEINQAHKLNKRGSHDGVLLLLNNKLSEASRLVFDIDVKIVALHSKISEGVAFIVSKGSGRNETAQIVIKVDGKSYTRHAVKVSDGRYAGWSIFGNHQLVHYKVQP